MLLISVCGREHYYFHADEKAFRKEYTRVDIMEYRDKANFEDET